MNGLSTRSKKECDIMNYDYQCPHCRAQKEVSHPMTASPVIACDVCAGVMKKAIIACNFSVQNTLAKNRFFEFADKERDAKIQLRDEFGVHQATPLSGSTMSSVLKDAKSSGSYVKDQMAMENAKNQARKAAKVKEWRPGAQKRADGKRAIMKEQKAKEAAGKRTITL